jgi:hypothetical protein
MLMQAFKLKDELHIKMLVEADMQHFAREMERERIAYKMSKEQEFLAAAKEAEEEEKRQKRCGYNSC